MSRGVQACYYLPDGYSDYSEALSGSGGIKKEALDSRGGQSVGGSSPYIRQVIYRTVLLTQATQSLFEKVSVNG